MDSDGSEDADLRAAIAASLDGVHGDDEMAKAKSKTKTVVDLTAETDDEDDDVIPIYPKSKSVIGSETSREVSVVEQGAQDEDEDEDLKRAIALSLQQSAEIPEEKERVERKDTASGFLGLDRKAMEQERLARLAKRKAEGSPAGGERETKLLRVEPGSSSTAAQPRQGQAPTLSSSVQFPGGMVKRTWAFGYHRVDDDIKIEEVLQKSDLELAVLSSFMWDMEWLFSKLDTKNTRFVLVMQAKDDATKRQYESETAAMSNLRLCFPPMDGQVNCMHSKLMLLFHPGYLRIAVPTANLVPYDWGEMGGIMENSVFLIDLPKKDSAQSSKFNTNFYNDLVYFLKASTLHENIIAKLENFDFSKTAQLAFVHSIGGSHSGSSWNRTGYCGLGRSLDALGLRSSKPISLDFVTSSLGSLNSDFMKCIYLAAQGDDGMTEYILRTAKSFPARNPSNPQRLIRKTTADEWKDRFCIYFPSQETVRNSKGGPRAAGTICFQSKWWEGPKFPRHVVRDCESRREGLLMHNKILYVRLDEPASLSSSSSSSSSSDTNADPDTVTETNPQTSKCPAWAYIGSANLSESAWGRLVQDRSTKQPKLNCRNWECGVVIPIMDNADSTDTDTDTVQDGHGKDTQKRDDSLDRLFKGRVPVPMRLPARSYEGSSRVPWYFMESSI